MGSSEAGRPSSSPAVGSGQKSSMPPGIGKAMPRISTAPSQLGDPSSRRLLGGPAARAKKTNGFPDIPSERWGQESADRFRLFSTVRSGKNNEKHLAGSCSGGGSTDGMGYNCIACQRHHVLVVSF